MKILLLEDDYSYRISIREYLISLEFEVDDFENGHDALNAVFENTYDLLLMDVLVPKVSGIEIVKAVRKSNLDLPIILVTSLTDLDDLSIGYDVGCNDYLRKPFALKELKYRINQAIHNGNFKTNVTLIPLENDFVFDVERYELRQGITPIKLTKIELKILEYLIRRRGFFSDTADIMATIWEYSSISESDLRMHIKRIRNKTYPELIVNARGMGYKIEKI